MKRRKKRRTHRREPSLFEWDANFAYIIGYTPAGFPYGVAWDEWEGPHPRDEEDDAYPPDEKLPF